MNDQDILQVLVKELKTVDHPHFTQNMIEFYEYLVSRVPEEGFKQIIDDKDLSIEQETAILQLKRYDYLDSAIQSITRGGIEHLVDLRGKRFVELAESQSKATMMQDSGKRQQFETGAVRDSADAKPRPDLISPFAIERLGEWLRLGALKYDERNWEKGIPVSRSLASLYRHLLKYQQGANDEDHMAACMCNAMFIIHTEEMIRRNRLPESLDDMPDYSEIPRVHYNKDEVLEHEPDEEFRWKAIHDKT